MQPRPASGTGTARWGRCFSRTRWRMRSGTACSCRSGRPTIRSPPLPCVRSWSTMATAKSSRRSRSSRTRRCPTGTRRHVIGRLPACPTKQELVTCDLVQHLSLGAHRRWGRGPRSSAQASGSLSGALRSHAIRRRTSQAHGGRRSPECETFFHAMTSDLAISYLDEAGRAQRHLP